MYMDYTLHGEDDFPTSGAGLVACNALVQTAVVDRHRRQPQRPVPPHRVPRTARRRHFAPVLQPRHFRFRQTVGVARNHGAARPDRCRDLRLTVSNRRSRFTRSRVNTVTSYAALSATQLRVMQWSGVGLFFTLTRAPLPKTLGEIPWFHESQETNNKQGHL